MNSDSGFPRAADPDVPEVRVPKIAHGFCAELQRICYAFEITVPNINIRALDFPPQRVITLQGQGVVPAAREAAIVHLNIAATDQVHAIARLFDRDVR